MSRLRVKRNNVSISIELRKMDIRNGFSKDKLTQIRYINTYKLNILNLLYRTYYGFKLLELVHSGETRIYTDILNDKAEKEFVEEDDSNNALFGIVVSSTYIQLHFLFSRITVYNKRTRNMLKRIKKEMKNEKV